MKETVFLNNDREMPLLGLGVYKLPDDVQAEAAVTSAISAGYRMIDTASVYKNEESVGRAIAKCGVPRKDLFITSKIWNNAQRLGDVQGAFSRSLDRLKVSYVDLYLIHWPVPGCYLSTWKELESILESGRALSIGVSNFDIRHLEELRKISGVIPAVNQIECHPLCYPAELIEYCKAFGIQVQAYAPLARGAYFDNDVFWGPNMPGLLHRSDFAGQYRREFLSFRNPSTRNESAAMETSLTSISRMKIWRSSIH